MRTYGSNYGTKNSSNFITDTRDTDNVAAGAPGFNFQNYQLKREESEEEVIQKLNQKFGSNIPV